MEKLRTDFAAGMPIQASETNKTNAAINALIDKVGEADVNTIYIDQTRVEAEGRVTGDIRGNVIRAIRAMSHGYLGKYDSNTHKMRLCQLSDSDFNKYANGDAADLTGAEGDVWMKLPEFWWKCERVPGTTASWAISFSLGEKEGWKHWDGKFLFGVYEAYSTARLADDTDFADKSVDDYGGTTWDNRTATLHSRSGIVSSGNICQAALRQEARNRGAGYSIVRWEQHTMMAMLFYAFYGHMDAQRMCGMGSGNCRKTTGKTDELGMNDTNYANGTGNCTSWDSNDGTSIKFWGLENWWGNKYEWLDNIYGLEQNGNREIHIYGEEDIIDPHSTVHRTLTVEQINIGNTDGYHAYLGENFDLLPDKDVKGESDMSYGYCDEMYADATEMEDDYYDENFEPFHLGYIGYRSGSNDNGHGGVACAYVFDDADGRDVSSGSRLAFKGEFVIVDEVDTFKNL